MEKGRQRLQGQTLIEIIVALALVALTVPAIFAALSGVIRGVDNLTDHQVRLELARSQLEYIYSQPYREDGDYPLIAVPAGYSIRLETAKIASYKYPDGRKSGEVQRITVVVSGRHGGSELEGVRFK